jgi:hypothetical protein
MPRGERDLRQGSPRKSYSPVVHSKGVSLGSSFGFVKAFLPMRIFPHTSQVACRLAPSPQDKHRGNLAIGTLESYIRLMQP